MTNTASSTIYYAHTPSEGSDVFETLEEHIHRAIKHALPFAEAMGLGKLARTATILHDTGKCSEEFQQYLRECHAAKCADRPAPRRGVDHKSAGALLAAEYCELLTPLVLGHHGGMPGVSEVPPRLQEAASMAPVSESITRAREVLARMPLPQSRVLLEEASARATTDLEADVLLRMLFSCLVDADSLATEEWFEPEDIASRTSPLSLGELWERLQLSQQTLMTKVDDTPVNRVRRAVYEDCLTAAMLPPGVFKLTVPTGCGKTRSSLAFALKHALKHGHQRVIYAIPYTSIIEQTADVFRGIFDDPRAVLEHHSAVDPEGEDEETAEWRGLASENWDAPLIVTTTVQFFESLFANRPGRCRKVHHIARSVVVLDEVQTLPLPLLSPILDMLRTMVTRYSVTVVLCTATQPALDGESSYLCGLPPAREIVKEPARHFQALKRVTYRVVREPWSWERVAAEMHAAPQCLVVLNTRKDALALLAALDDPDAIHLSTLLCPAHRRAVLAEVRRRLKKGLPCRLVATQVIEAGVDVDFPLVLRAIGPLDRIVQAAGRCNREGRRHQGTVIIFTPAEGGLPRGDYRTAFDHARQTLADPALDLHDPDVFSAYFRRVYADVDLDARNVQEHRKHLRFPEVAEKFRLIDQDTVALLVPYQAATIARLIDEARAQGRVTREAWRVAQQHSVSVYRYEFTRWQQEGLVQEVVAGSGLYEWLGGYDAVRGLAREARDAADLIC